MGYSKQRFSCYDVNCWKMTQKVDQNETTAIIFVSGGKWIKKKGKIRKLFYARTRIYKSLYYFW